MSSEERFIEAISTPRISRHQVGAQRFGSIAAFDLGNRNISGGDRPERVFTALALTDLFGPFGLRPALGRGFTAEELAAGAGAAVISHRLWQGRFGGEPDIVGSAVKVNGAPTTVVGVMPPELLILGADLWLPWRDRSDASAAQHAAVHVDRAASRPARSLEQANVELATIAAAWRQRSCRASSRSTRAGG